MKWARGRAALSTTLAGAIVNRMRFALPIIAGLVIPIASQGHVTKEQAALVDEGRRVFNEETFGGNGRTCSTCHIPAEGYNISPADIAKLPKKQRDLVFMASVPGFENAALIETRALFNISGGPAPLCPGDDPSCFDDDDGHSGPVFRASMNIEALDLTTRVDEDVVADGDFHGTPLLPPECSTGVELDLPQLGWAGDGSPGTPKVLDGDDVCQMHHGAFDMDADGSIRAFASGAIAQHFTRSLNRIPGVDFRRATADELDALEAFQRWLGRRPLTEEENAAQGTENATEFNILQLDFKDPRVALGRDHFASNDGATCNSCHANAGALGGGGGGNNNAITSVALAADDIGVPIVGFPIPDDEGTTASAFAGGDTGTLAGAFNTQSLTGVALKKAWFHNHKVVGNFEEAIAHYGSDDFLVGDPVTNPRSRPIPTVKPQGGLEGLKFGGQAAGAAAFPAGDGIEHLGAFLRALNAFYLLRDCERLTGEAIDRIELGVSADNPIQHCLFNLSHVTRVLRESKLPGLHTDVQKKARLAHTKLAVLQVLAELAQGKRNGTSGQLRSPAAARREILNRLVEAGLHQIDVSVLAMRDSIATQIAAPGP